MRIYEINEAIERMVAEAVDPETGEVNLDFAALDALQMERDTKIENLALLIKNTSAEAEAIGNEIERLTERKRRAEKEITRMKDYLTYVLGNQKFETPKVAVSFRKSQKVDTTESFLTWASEWRPDLIRVKTEADKTAIKKALKDGAEIPGVEIKESYSLTIK